MEAAPAGLRERKKRDKRRRILAAARRLFEREGFDGATARAICREAGIGTGTLFLYVRDKRELLFLVFQDDARRLFAEGSAAARQERELVPALMRLFGAFIGFYAQRPQLSRLVVQELFFREHDLEQMGALTSEYASHVSALVERAQERGELRRDVAPREAATACFAHYAFWVQAWLGSRLASRNEAERRLRAALVQQVEGLRPPARRSGA